MRSGTHCQLDSTIIDCKAIFCLNVSSCAQEGHRKNSRAFRPSGIARKWTKNYAIWHSLPAWFDCYWLQGDILPQLVFMCTRRCQKRFASAPSFKNGTRNAPNHSPLASKTQETLCDGPNGTCKQTPGQRKHRFCYSSQVIRNGFYTAAG